VLPAELSGRSRRQGEISGDGDLDFRRRRSCDIDPDTLQAERSTTDRVADIVVPTHDDIVDEGGTDIVRMADRRALAEEFAPAGGAHQVLGAGHWIARQFRVEVAPVEPRLGQVIVYAPHELILVLLQRTVERDVAVGRRGFRNQGEQFLRHRVDAAGGYEISGKGLLVEGIDELPRESREVPAPLCWRQHECGEAAGDVAGLGSLVSAEKEQL